MNLQRTSREPPLRALRRLMDRPPAKRAGEVCEMCGRPIEEPHPHVVDIETRNLLCACRPCYLLFTFEVAVRGRYRAVPERYLHDPAFILSEAQWDGLQIPVRMAFFFQNSSIDRMVAFYPSPAGATESTLALDAWEDVVRASPALTALQPDVEALLVYGGRGQAFECHLVPIDACYELTGIVKRSWKGFDGGEEAWARIDAFFALIRERSRPLEERR